MRDSLIRLEITHSHCDLLYTIAGLPSADKNVQYSLIENDDLGDWSSENDSCWRLTFRQPVWKPSLESLDSKDGFHRVCRNVSHQQRSFSGLQTLR